MVVDRRELGVTSEVERRDGEQKRRSGSRGTGSGKRRRSGQPVDDIRVRILRWGDEKSFVGDEE
jgi:hypothetical protein